MEKSISWFSFPLCLYETCIWGSWMFISVKQLNVQFQWNWVFSTTTNIFWFPIKKIVHLYISKKKYLKIIQAFTEIWNICFDKLKVLLYSCNFSKIFSDGSIDYYYTYTNFYDFLYEVTCFKVYLKIVQLLKRDLKYFFMIFYIS